MVWISTFQLRSCSSFPPVNKQIKKEKSNHEIQCKEQADQIPLFGDPDLWENELR